MIGDLIGGLLLAAFGIGLYGLVLMGIRGLWRLMRRRGPHNRKQDAAVTSGHWIGLISCFLAYTSSTPTQPSFDRPSYERWAPMWTLLAFIVYAIYVIASAITHRRGNPSDET